MVSHELWSPLTAVLGAVQVLKKGLYDDPSVPKLLDIIERNTKVQLSTLENLLDVSRIVAGILKLADSDTNDPVNIGNPHEMTIEGIAKTIIKMTGSKSRIIYQDLPVDDPKVRQPDITKARTLLGWEPKVKLEQGLVKTIEYFKRKMGV